VTANPQKTLLGLKEVEYDGNLISFTAEKRLQVLDFPLPTTEKALLQLIGLVNYFRDHVPQMTAMVQPLRKLIDMKKYKDSKKLNLTDESIAAFHFFRQAVSYCQELYFWKTRPPLSYKLMHLTMILVDTYTGSPITN